MVMNSSYQLETVNLELTTACPLRCPQCYCSLMEGRHLDIEIAKRRVDEAKELGAKMLLLSGGETLCYPHLYELIAYAFPKIPDIRISVSGCFFDQNAFEKLIEAGVSEISVSLNGSTQEINTLTRDGYEYAIESLKLLKENAYQNTVINWVMHSNNTEDFPNIVSLAEKYNVKGILILGLKPNLNKKLTSFPSFEQMIFISKYVWQYSGKVKLMLDSCYSPFLAFHRDTKLFGNFNTSDIYKGCGAGRNGLSVSVSGALTPCRHLLIEEQMTMSQYWNSSDVLSTLRSLDDKKSQPCNSCKYTPYCRHCISINWEIRNALTIGFEGCPVFERIK